MYTDTLDDPPARHDVNDGHRHAWMSYMVDKAPVEDKIMQRQQRAWEPAEHKPTLTWTRAAYRPYSTYVSSNPERFSSKDCGMDDGIAADLV